jgi:hypothetical protein
MKIFRFLENIIMGIKDVFHRFPIPMMFCVAGTTIGILFVHDIDEIPLPNILWTLFLGFPLFVSATLWAEKKHWTSSIKSISYLICAGFLVFYYLLLPENIMESEGQYIFRSILWITGFILLITFIPFSRTHNRKNKSVLGVQSIIVHKICSISVLCGRYICRTFRSISRH